MTTAGMDRGALVDALLDDLADRIADRLADRLASSDAGALGDPWLDVRAAVAYTSKHADTLRKLAREGAIPHQQDGPGAKMFFRRSVLDDWLSGRGVRSLRSVA